MNRFCLPFVLVAISCGATTVEAPALDEGALSRNARGAPAGTACAVTHDCAIGLSCFGAPLHCAPPSSPAMASQGGPVVAAMKVYTVVWRGDEDLGREVDAFNARFLASDLFAGRLAEYGVGPGTAAGVIVLGAPPPSVRASGADFEEAIANAVGQTTLDGAPVGPPTPDTVFAFIVPKGTKGGGGYWHSETTRSVASAEGRPIHVPYIVDEQADPFLSPFDYLTWSHSHELMETATDPLPDNDPGWLATDAASNSEVADLCNDIPVTAALDGRSYAISRVYSAKKALLRDGDPCLPALPGTYANVAIAPNVVHVAAGEGTTVRLVPFAFGPEKPQLHWQLYLGKDYRATPNRGTSAPGDDVTVQITRAANAPKHPEPLQIWVTTQANRSADVPTQESFGGLLAD
jgi:hypothetical protein